MTRNQVTGRLVFFAALPCALLLWHRLRLTPGYFGGFWDAALLTLAFGSAIPFVALSVKGLAMRVGPRSFNSAFCVVGLFLVAYQLVPLVSPGIEKYDPQLRTLISNLDRGERIAWPVTVGRLKFVGGQSYDLGAFLFTDVGGAGSRGVFWSRRPDVLPACVRSHLDGPWYTYSTGSN